MTEGTIPGTTIHEPSMTGSEIDMLLFALDRSRAQFASTNLRRMLVDLHDEYARQVGHADLLREAFDGLVGEDPPQT